MMTVLTPPQLTVPIETAARSRRYTVAEYFHMIDVGLIPEDNTYELLEGWVVEKVAKHEPHIFAYNWFSQMLFQVVPSDQFAIFTQDPIVLRQSVPEPDVLVAQGPLTNYKRKKVRPSEALLVVEVSDSTLAQDRTVKQRIYAEARIPFYWILNLIDNVTEVYTNPHGGADSDGEAATYDAPTTYAPDAPVPLILAGKEIARLDLSHCY